MSAIIEREGRKEKKRERERKREEVESKMADNRLVSGVLCTIVNSL